MNISIIAEWGKVDLIRYLIVATVVLGLMKSIKMLTIRR